MGKNNLPPRENNLITFSVLHKESQGLRSVDCVRMRKRNLKKQSQYSKGQNDIMSISAMVYGDFSGPRRRKNKANSNPIFG